MGEMSSGAIHGGPQRIGTAACKEQSFGGLSAVQLLAQKWRKWSFGYVVARGNQVFKVRFRSEQHFRAYNAVLAFR